MIADTEALRALQGQITKGPWICYADLPSVEPNWHIVTTANKMRVLANVHIEPGNAMDKANAEAFTMVPDLLTRAISDAETIASQDAELIRLRAEVERMLPLIKLVNDSFGGGLTMTFTEQDAADFAAAAPEVQP